MYPFNHKYMCSAHREMKIKGMLQKIIASFDSTKFRNRSKTLTDRNNTNESKSVHAQEREREREREREMFLVM